LRYYSLFAFFVVYAITYVRILVSRKCIAAFCNQIDRLCVFHERICHCHLLCNYIIPLSPRSSETEAEPVHKEQHIELSYSRGRDDTCILLHLLCVFIICMTSRNFEDKFFFSSTVNIDTHIIHSFLSSILSSQIFFPFFRTCGQFYR